MPGLFPRGILMLLFSFRFKLWRGLYIVHWLSFCSCSCSCTCTCTCTCIIANSIDRVSGTNNNIQCSCSRCFRQRTPALTNRRVTALVFGGSLSLAHCLASTSSLLLRYCAEQGRNTVQQLRLSRRCCHPKQLYRRPIQKRQLLSPETMVGKLFRKVC